MKIEMLYRTVLHMLSVGASQCLLYRMERSASLLMMLIRLIASMVDAPHVTAMVGEQDGQTQSTE